MVAFRKNFHAQQIEAPSAGIEIKRLAGGILQRFGRGEILFKYKTLVLSGYTDAAVFNFKLRPALSSADRYVDPASVGCVFDGFQVLGCVTFVTELLDGLTRIHEEAVAEGGIGQPPVADRRAPPQAIGHWLLGCGALAGTSWDIDLDSKTGKISIRRFGTGR